MGHYYIGVDVGTGSARAGVFDARGELLGVAKSAIAMAHPKSDWAEQSTTDIWRAVCYAVKTARQQAGVAADMVAAIGFDATCSLALADKNGKPLDISGDDSQRDVIVWMDQRAVAEARLCSATGAEPLKYVGGTMSPEMQMPKLLWLKKQLPEHWQRLGYAGDLSDWLTWRATGSAVRSVCTLTCKWGFMPHRQPTWDSDFLNQIGLTDLFEKTGLPETTQAIGTAIGTLNNEAANDLALHTDCLVSGGMIDAHAGALLSFSGVNQKRLTHHLGLVAGTSNCHMAMHSSAQPITGVWGPYQGVVLPDLWLNEGGQTATGALLDHLCQTYQGASAFTPNVHEILGKQLVNDLQQGIDPAPGLHVLPDFIGNRSPHADSAFRGVISGLTFDTPEVGFKKLYFAAAAAIAYGTRAIIERMNVADYQIDTVILTGGHAKSELLTKLYADACQVTLLLPDTEEPVLLGSAINAAAAHHGDLSTVMTDMQPAFKEYHCDSTQKSYHDARYQAFEQLYTHYRQLR